MAVVEVPEPVGVGVEAAETVEFVMVVLLDTPVAELPVAEAVEAHDALVGTWTWTVSQSCTAKLMVAVCQY